MTADYNGWADAREDEREGLEQWEAASEDSWRGDQHLEDWPESLAGPEYWLYKQALKSEGEDGTRG